MDSRAVILTVLNRNAVETVAVLILCFQYFQGFTTPQPVPKKKKQEQLCVEETVLILDHLCHDILESVSPWNSGHH